MKSEALIYKKDRALYADMIAALDEQRAELIYDSETTLLLHETAGDIHMLASRDFTEAKPLLQKLLEADAVVVLHGAKLAKLAEEMGFQLCAPCCQVFYAGALLPQEGELTVRHPDGSEFDLVNATYTLSDTIELRQDFDRPDFLGGYVDGKLACYIGLHCEGSMGMLEVFPEYRRRGYAQQIYSTLINNQLLKGRLPYAQIFITNTNSLNLQKKLGFQLSTDTIQWAWKPEA